MRMGMLMFDLFVSMSVSVFHSLEKFPQILMQAREILERFIDALSCIDQCFIADRMLEELPAPSSLGKTKVGGIDLNKARMRWVVEALIALCVSPLEAQGFTSSELARQVRLLSNQSESDRHADTNQPPADSGQWLLLWFSETKP